MGKEIGPRERAMREARERRVAEAEAARKPPPKQRKPKKAAK